MDFWRLTFYMQDALTDEDDIILVVEEGEKYSVYRELTNDIKGGSFLLVSDTEGEEYLIPKNKIHYISVLPQDIKYAVDSSDFILRSANNTNGGAIAE